MVTFLMMIQSDPLSLLQNFHIFYKKQKTTTFTSTTKTTDKNKNVLKDLAVASDHHVKYAHEVGPKSVWTEVHADLAE